MAQDLVKKPLIFIEPIKGVQTPEITYYGSTMISVLSTPKVHAISLPKSISLTALPVLWNYLDATAAITLGLNLLLDDNNYRRSQKMAKGLLYILSGLQSFILTYNPPLVAALGITGAPAALAGTAFAFSTLVDFLIATIDYCNACKMSTFSGWMDETIAEYAFIVEAIKNLQIENEQLQTMGDKDDSIQWAISVNTHKIAEFETRLKGLKEIIIIRAVANKLSLTEAHKRFLDTNKMDYSIGLNTAIENYNTQLQETLNKDLEFSRNTLLIKFASFVAIALITTATFILLTTCPQAVFTVGLSISILVSASYLYRHKDIIENRCTAFFKPANNNHASTENKDNTSADSAGAAGTTGAAGTNGAATI